MLSLIVNLAACASPAVIYTSSPNTLIAQGLRAESAGNIDTATRAYTEAAKLSGRGNMYLGNLAYQQKDFAAAEHQYRLALRDVPDNAALYNNLAWSLLKQKHKLDEAEEFAMLAVQRSDEKTLSLTWETLNTIRQIRNKPISALPPKRLLQSKKKLPKKISPKKVSTKKDVDSVQEALDTIQQPDTVQEALDTIQQPDTVQEALDTIQQPDTVQEALDTMQKTPASVQQALDELGNQFVKVRP